MKARVTVAAGALFRGQVRREIERECFARRLGLSIKENRRLIQSTYLIEVDGEDQKVRQFVADLNDTLGQWEIG